MPNVPVMKLRPIFKCHGGKFFLGRWIINHFPANYPDLKYVETSGGAASVLLNKTPSSSLDVYNELNPRIANIFSCLKSDPVEFIDKVSKIDYSDLSFKEAGKVTQSYGSVDSGIAELVLRRMSRGGLGKNFSWSERLRGGRPGDLNAWITFKSLLPKLAERLKDVEISNHDQLEVIAKHDSENTIFYCDPPYVHSTRTAKSAYDFEMTDEIHIQLAESLNCIKGKALISGYDCELYNTLYKNWRRVSKSVKNNAGQGKIKGDRIEVLWLNY
jgi:DNA adenine methylase